MAEIEGKHSNAQQPFSAIAMQTPAMATSFSGENNLADRVGFEPTVRLPARWFSRPVPSTTRPPVHGSCL